MARVSGAFIGAAALALIAVGGGILWVVAGERFLGRLPHFDVNIESLSVDHAVAEARGAGAPVAYATMKDGSVRLYPTVSDRDRWSYFIGTADSERGAAINRDGTKAGVAACASCHGGNEQPRQPGMPAIHGLDMRYLASQLDRYATGARVNEVMSDIAKALDGQERADLAVYLASLLPGPMPEAAAASEAVLARGAALDSLGDDAKRIASCGACHGTGGNGGLPRIPSLAGQDPDYLAARLTALRALSAPEGREPGAAIMAAVAKKMSDDDIAAAAAFYARAAHGAKPAP